MTVLALDVGDRRIGVALSDPEGRLAVPLTTIDRGAESEDIDGLLALVSARAVREIVVGMPLTLSGRMGQQARGVSDFARALEQRADVPVKTFDERFSTVEAERLMREAGRRPSKEKAGVDAAAATVILQAYLDSVVEKRAGR